ncbi:hypothetical protein GCM10027059_12530 [Myceligenerans halotolerans]
MIGGVQSTSTSSGILYRRSCEAVNRRDLPTLRDLAANPALTREALAVVAPSLREPDADTCLVGLVLDHPECNAAIASRYATHHDPAIRTRVASFPGLGSACLAVLAEDREPGVRDTAREALLALGHPWYAGREQPS